MKYKIGSEIVEAMQYKRGNISEIHSFIHKHIYGDSSGSFYFGTIDGTVTVSKGDYVVKKETGEIFSCKPDIFERDYKAVE